MRLLRDPFLNRLLVTLAIYSAFVGLWMRHSPGTPTQPLLVSPGGPHARP